MTELRLGFAGVGKMGGLMAARLIGASHPLTVFDANDLAAEPLVKAGARRAKTLHELAGQARLYSPACRRLTWCEKLRSGQAALWRAAPRNCLSICPRPDPGWPGWSPKVSPSKVLRPWIAR